MVYKKETLVWNPGQKFWRRRPVKVFISSVETTKAGDTWDIIKSDEPEFVGDTQANEED